MALETARLARFSQGEALESAGTPFGSATVMPSFTPRQRDRREAMSSMLASLTHALDRRLDVSLMRGAFETALAQVIPVRTVRLRELGSRWGSRGDAAGPEAITLDVPGADPSSQAVLDVTFDPGSRLGDWDFQMLGTAANL